MIVVTSLADSGAGTLRAALAAAAVGEEITFSVTGTITLVTQLTISQSVIITGPGKTNLTIDGNNAVRGFNITAGVNTISGISMSHCTGNPGGAIQNAATTTLSDITFSLCSSANTAGCIRNTSTIIGTNIVITGCTSTAQGGAIWNSGTLTLNQGQIDSCFALSGAAIYNQAGTVSITGYYFTQNFGSDFGTVAWSSGTLTLTECEVFENFSFGLAGVVGHLYNFTGTLNFVRSTARTHVTTNVFYNETATLNIINSTIAENTTVDPVVENFEGSVSFTNSTITGNTGSGVHQASDGFVEFYNTIICQNVASPEFDIDVPEENMTSNGGNVFGTTRNPITPAAQDQFGVSAANLNIQGLAQNGGPTRTCALNEGSFAIDEGIDVDSPATDQRGAGFPRVVGNTIDVGAYEFTPFVPPEPPDFMDTNVLLDEAKCINMCIPQGAQMAVLIYLAFQILQNIDGGSIDVSAAIYTYSGSGPVAPPDNLLSPAISYHEDGTNPTYVWDISAQQWV